MTRAWRPLAGVLAISVLLVGLAVAPGAFLRATGRTSVEAIARILSGSTLVGLTALVAASRGGVVAFGAAVAASSGVALVVMLPAAMRAAGATRPRLDLAHWRGLFVAAAPLGVAMLFTAVYYYADSLMLGAFGQREALARYNVAYVFVLAVAAAIAALRNGFLPAQARGHASDADLSRILTVYFRITAMLAVPLIIIGPIVAVGALRVVYGPAYVPAASALRPLLVTAGVMCFSSYFGSNLLLCGRQRAYLTATIVGAFANVALNVVLIPRYSLSGAASATLAAEAGVCVFVAMQNRDFAPPQFVRALVLPAAISCAVAVPLALGLARVGLL